MGYVQLHIVHIVFSLHINLTDSLYMDIWREREREIESEGERGRERPKKKELSS